MNKKVASQTSDRKPPASEDVPLITGSNAPPVRTEAPPASLEVAIGAKVRRLRQRLGITAADLAAEADLSAGMLSKIENGSTSPSLATLQALSRALNTPISSFFSDFDERRDCSYVPAGMGLSIERRGTKAGHKYELLGHSLGSGLAVEPYLITLSKDAAPYTQFQHKGTELIFMLSGSIRYRHGDGLYTLNPGDMLSFDSAALHGPEELTELPAQFLSIIVYNRE
ncbi:helix-turn-helix domain-containing protein [Granulibacter bethesdensis]|uniref:helix-turn-helix domain-containing protein n=1 Tax=Granulibacter bethesdensis TaxID=364410 RepID=UPI00090B5D8B|nr:XRE family transcriptional regulator [Granulibacter bethesdensis]APH58471.1 Transcriptional regulator [Granulibacter bethesdensis]